MIKRYITIIFLIYIIFFVTSCNANRDINVDLKREEVSIANEDKLFEAIKKNKTSEAIEILKNEIEINKKDEDKNRPLYYAIMTNNAELVKLLIEKGANVNLPSSNPKYCNMTAAHIAIEQNNYEILKVIIKSKVDLSIKDANGNTPLHLAVKKDNLDFIKILVDNGAKIDVVNKERKTPMHIAASLNKEKLLAIIKDMDYVTFEIQMQENTSFSNEQYFETKMSKSEVLDFYTDGKKSIKDKYGNVRYIGEICSGRINGYGTAYSGFDGGIEGNQILYAGNWKDGYWHGKGKQYSCKYTIDLILMSTSLSKEEVIQRWKKQKNYVEYEGTYDFGKLTGDYIYYYEDGTIKRGNKEAESTADTNIKDVEVNKYPAIGMTKEDIEKSSWGKPISINRTTTAYTIREQWIYSGYRYIYFEGEKVIAIQDH